jgi:hypothetical protein
MAGYSILLVIKKVTENVKLTFAVIGIITTIITAGVTITLKYQEITQLLNDHQKEIDKISQLQADHTKLTNQIYWMNKRAQSQDSIIRIQNQNISNLFWYKFPYGQWGNTAGNTTNYNYPIQNPK